MDVLDPQHCDFAALRTAILSTHLKVLKIHTKEVLYEKYRTEKLLVREATRNISDEEKERLLKGQCLFRLSSNMKYSRSLHPDMGL